ncbi:MAG TPA: hypothetical protein VGQ57_01825 [Polyangiaceae bacterium]|jgi:hypothetical protein|nr:hypothetical protein [Polyangiaceae bacterium]
MLRLAQALWFVLPAALATGCPMYSDKCDASGDCAAGYVCNASSDCVEHGGDAVVPPDPDTPARCETTSDCAEGLECDRFKRCTPPAGTGGAAGDAGAGGEAGSR